MSFMMQHGGTLAVGALVAVVLSAIIVKLVKDKKAGKGCTCGCSACPMEGKCHSEGT